MRFARVCDGFCYPGLGRRLINAAAGIAELAGHARAATARIGPLTLTLPRAVRMVLTHPAGGVAIQARHGLQIGAKSAQGILLFWFGRPECDAAVATLSLDARPIN
jgi:hypothetical protein